MIKEKYFWHFLGLGHKEKKIGNKAKLLKTSKTNERDKQIKENKVLEQSQHKYSSSKWSTTSYNNKIKKIKHHSQFLGRYPQAWAFASPLC
jgi:hypothetical protein